MNYYDLINKPFAISLEELLKLLKDEYHKTRRDAAYCLARDYPRDPRLLEAWIEALQDWDGEVKGQAIAVLREYQDPRIVNLLQPLLKNEDSGVRWAVLEVLDNYNEPTVLDVMLTALEDEDENVLDKLQESLAQYSNLALEPLLEAIYDSNPKRKRGAIYCLEYYDDQRMLEPLLKIFADRIEPGDTRRYAANASSDFIDERITDAFIKVLKDKTDDSEARAGAAYNLGSQNFVNEQIVDLFIKLLEDKAEDIKVRVAAAFRLGGCGIKRAAQALTEATKDASQSLREKSVRYIHRVNLKDSEKILTEALNDPDHYVQLAASEALREYRKAIEAG